MQADQRTFLSQVNFARYRAQPQGHYESYFQRANHPERPLAFWIRYTLFSPKSKPHEAIGELWAIFFNGETNQHIAVKRELKLKDCNFNPADFDVRVGDAFLKPGELKGAVQAANGEVSWDLTYDGKSAPLLLLPFGLYRTKFPAAKSLVSLPTARYNGHLSVNGESIEIKEWVGSQNHNWGSRHTDHYAWGQVAGFDTDPDAFLEVATARLRLGPLWTPPITPMVLRYKGQEFALNGLLKSMLARASIDYFTWRFEAGSPQVEITGTITAPRQAFVGLIYYNPPGGTKHCLNTKIASCSLHLRNKTLGTAETLETRNRAAFEILTDDSNHGVPIAV